VSPLTIPNCSLHALASTISLALGIHGPAFGVGGGPGHLAEGLLGAFSLQQEQRCPGVWLVLTSWEPYQHVDASGNMMAPAVCHGVALALTSPEAGLPRFQLRRIAGQEPTADPILSELARFLGSPRPSRWQTDCGGDRLELSAA
ncbi:MAG: hypothetical protein JNM56_36615, partial [Planctomycetia bacterium]|nr:hypothetical protein [Planctomycetia bacterium]